MPSLMGEAEFLQAEPTIVKRGDSKNKDMKAILQTDRVLEKLLASSHSFPNCGARTSSLEPLVVLI